MKPRKPKFNWKQLKKLLAYDSKTGQFTWRTDRRGVAAGSRAGSRLADGYWRIKIDYMPYKAHRLAWFHYYGVWPDRPVRHINGDRSDNRIANLKLRN